MIRHEFLKYGRQFRWLILLYVGWLVLVTIQACTHVVLPDSSDDHWLLITRQLETKWEPISMALLAMVMISIWLQDSLWEPRAFWRTRPASRMDHLSSEITLARFYLEGYCRESSVSSSPFRNMFRYKWDGLRLC